jgi:pilus assembly protein TadC
MPYGLFVLDVGDRLDRSMIFAIMSMIYAGTILFFVGTTALILLAWARRRYADRSPNDLIYVAVSIILLVSAGIGIFVASQIVVALGLSA